jgi:hypothetical protein
MKAKWMDIEAKVWFIEQNGSIKMDSTIHSITVRKCNKLDISNCINFDI